MTTLELVDPVGRLHVVPSANLLAFCKLHSLDRPDNVERLPTDNNKNRYVQNWQALNKLRWLKFVDTKTMQRIEGVPLQPVLGGTGYFLKYVACSNPKMVDKCGRVIFIEKEFSRLLGKSPPPHYKGWARAELTLEQARKFFEDAPVPHTHRATSPQVCRFCCAELVMLTARGWRPTAGP